MTGTALNGSCRMNLRYKMADNVTWPDTPRRQSHPTPGGGGDCGNIGMRGDTFKIECENECEIKSVIKSLNRKHLGAMQTGI